MSRTTIVQVAALAAAVTAAVLLAGDRDSGGRLGEPCDQPGQVVVEDGRQVACTTTLVDRQPRWRTGQLDLPIR
ncbi:hypothetical protein [Micromonospora sp. NPDC005113]